MTNISFLKKNRWILIQLALVLILAVLILFNNLSFDFITFKTDKSIKSRLFYIATVLTPFSILFLFSHFYKLPWNKKLLLSGLVLLFIGTYMRKQLFFQTSIVFSVVVLVNLFLEKKLYRPNLFYLSLFGYFAINCISLLWSPNVTLGLYYLRAMSPLVFIPLLFSAFKLSKKDFDMVALFVLRISLILIFFSFYSWILQSRFLDFPLKNSLLIKKYSFLIYNSFDIVFAWTNHTHPTYNGLYFLFALIIGWYYISKKSIEDNVAKIEFVLLIISILFISIITASRFLILGWLVVNIAGVFFVSRKKKKTLIPIVILITILFSGLTISFSKEIRKFVNDPVRTCHYDAAFQAIEENTWLGTGIGGMTKYININNPMYKSLNLSETDLFPHQHPHNQFIGDMMQSGVAGLAAILVIMASLVFYGIKRRNWMLLVLISLFFLLMLIEMPLMYSQGIFSFILFFCFLISMPKKENESSPSNDIS